MKVSYTRAEAEALSADAMCPRDGGQVRVDWLEVEPSEWIVQEAACMTPGCVDAEGGRRVPV